MFMEHTPIRKWKAGLGRERSWHTHGCHQGLSQPFRDLGSWNYFQSIPNRGLCVSRTATQLSLAEPWERHNSGRGSSQRLRAIPGEGCTSELLAADNPTGWGLCVPWLWRGSGQSTHHAYSTLSFYHGTHHLLSSIEQQSSACVPQEFVKCAIPDHFSQGHWLLPLDCQIKI